MPGTAGDHSFYFPSHVPHSPNLFSLRKRNRELSVDSGRARGKETTLDTASLVLDIPRFLEVGKVVGVNKKKKPCSTHGVAKFWDVLNEINKV